MGMSHDFHVAIEEGATMVRVGTAIFGERRCRQSMKVTPLDLRQQKFKTVMRGYDRAEVESFLAETADDYETGAARGGPPPRRPRRARSASLEEHREQRAQPAQHAAHRAEAGRRDPDERRAEGKRLVREAEGRADLMLQKTQSRARGSAARDRRPPAEAARRRELARGHDRALRNALEFVREQDVKEREDKVLLHRPRTVETPAAAHAARRRRAEGRRSLEA